jgi:hypothetical protein
MTPGRCGFGPGMVVGRLAGEEPGLFDVCECGTLVSCAFGPKCPENPHVKVMRCKACTLRGKEGLA